MCANNKFRRRFWMWERAGGCKFRRTQTSARTGHLSCALAYRSRSAAAFVSPPRQRWVVVPRKPRAPAARHLAEHVFRIVRHTAFLQQRDEFVFECMFGMMLGSGSDVLLDGFDLRRADAECAIA